MRGVVGERITEQLPTTTGRRSELLHKERVVQKFLTEQKLDALLISRHENIAWATAGIVDLHVGLLREIAIGSLLLTRDGKSYYITTNNEAPRLEAEEFQDLGYTPVILPWHTNDVPAAIQKIVGEGKVAGDDAAFGFPVVSLKQLRIPLTNSEIERYRWLGQRVADAATEMLISLRPGMTELEMQARVSERLLINGILPSVFLTAVDDRIRLYRHAVPRSGVLDRFGMLNFCARRWGLCISITRLAYFGAMPSELADNFAAVAQVNASLLHATREGASADKLFTTARLSYAEHGYPGEEQMHHQGGVTGYWEREWVARPGGTECLLDSQAVAWNPSIQGAKIEDTVILCGGKIETLTNTPRLPVVETTCDGAIYQSSGPLML